MPEIRRKAKEVISGKMCHETAKNLISFRYKKVSVWQFYWMINDGVLTGDTTHLQPWTSDDLTTDQGLSLLSWRRPVAAHQNTDQTDHKPHSQPPLPGGVSAFYSVSTVQNIFTAMCPFICKCQPPTTYWPTVQFYRFPVPFIARHISSMHNMHFASLHKV